MNNLMVKEVNFNGVNMLACKNNEDELSVSIKSICNGLGIDYSSQLKRINRDETLIEGVVKMTIPSNGGIQEANMLNIEYLPFFLVGIKSSMCREEVRNNLINFKLKAKDVLANAFIEKVNNALQGYLDLSEEDRAIAYFQKSKENKKLQLQLETTKEILEDNKDDIEMAKQITETNNVYDLGVFSKMLCIPNLGRNNFYKWLRNNKVLMSDNTPYQTYSKYFKVIAIDNAFQNSKTLVRVNGIKYIIKKLIKDEYLEESFNVNKLIDKLEKTV